MKELRELSKGNYDGAGTIENINAGSLQRIAAATEKMASSYDAMRDDRDMYKRWYNEEQARRAKLLKSNNSLRGVITKLKKKLAAG